MTDITDTQSLILSTACARESGLIFPVTANLKGGAVGNVCKSLLKRGLIVEILAADPDTVWRHGDAGSLTGSRAGFPRRRCRGRPPEKLEPGRWQEMGASSRCPRGRVGGAPSDGAKSDGERQRSTT